MSNQYKLTIVTMALYIMVGRFKPDKLTVAGTIQSTFKVVFDRDIKLVGASRTDAGVHALGQIAVFETDLIITTGKIITRVTGKIAC